MKPGNNKRNVKDKATVAAYNSNKSNLTNNNSSRAISKNYSSHPINEEINESKAHNISNIVRESRRIT